MTEPRVAAAGGIYTVTWESLGITARVDRLAENSKFELTAEVLIRSTEPPNPGTLNQARLNLTSNPARLTLVKTLLARQDPPQGTDWDTIIQRMCLLVLEKYRQGEPIINLATHEISESIGYRLAPVLREKAPVLLFGEGGIGKSFVAMYFATLVASGTESLGFEPEPGKVLYLDWESDPDDLALRLGSVAAGLGVARPDITYCFTHKNSSLRAGCVGNAMF